MAGFAQVNGQRASREQHPVRYHRGDCKNKNREDMFSSVLSQTPSAVRMCHTRLTGAGA